VKKAQEKLEGGQNALYDTTPQEIIGRGWVKRGDEGLARQCRKTESLFSLEKSLQSRSPAESMMGIGEKISMTETWERGP